MKSKGFRNNFRSNVAGLCAGLVLCAVVPGFSQEEEENGDSAWKKANALLNEGKTKEALPLLRTSAKFGEVEAKEKLAIILLMHGRAGWPEGLKWLDQAVQDGSVGAMELQAEILLVGKYGIEPSPIRAKELVERARQKPGARDAYFLLGKIMAEGIGVEPDAALALAHLRKGVEVGSVKAMVTLHDLYLQGALVERNLKEAESFALKAWALGSGEAAYKLAVLYEKIIEGAPDWKQALIWYERARGKGHAGATTRLGTCALNGWGKEVDVDTAFVLFQEAAGKGDAEAAYAISTLYEKGLGVPQDWVAGVGWLRAAAEGGHVLGQNEYGIKLLNGVGVFRNAAEAAKWFEKASNNGFAPAIVNMGDLYTRGIGIVKDPVKGLRMYEIAARKKYKVAYHRLALFYKQGMASNGIADPVGAAYWATKAANADEAYKELADKFVSDLDESQKDELKRRLGVVDKEEGLEELPAEE